MPLVLDGTNGVSGVDGTASNPAIEGTDSNTGIFYPAADTVAIGTGGTEALRVDSARNMGLGATPQTWYSTGGTSKAFQFGDSSSLYDFSASGNRQTHVLNNAYLNSAGSWRYLNSDAAARYMQQAGAHIWYYAASGTAGNAITFTQAMTLDASGNLGVGGGATSPASLFDVANSGAVTATIRSTSTGGTRDAKLRLNVPSTGGDDPAGTVEFTYGTGYTVAGSIQMTHTNNNMKFFTGTTERARITSGGDFLVGTTTAIAKLTVSSGNAQNFELVNNSVSTGVGVIGASSTSFATGNTAFNVARSANSAYSFVEAWSGGFSDIEFKLRGDGNGLCDGSWTGGGADYAEYFESATGAALTLGATIVLDGNKVREATDQDPVSAIMGVVRPKEPSKASAVVGNAAWNKWANKYLTDDFDRYIMEDHDVLEWTDEDGKQHSYESHNIPAGVTVPDDAIVKTHDDKGNKFQHYKLNPAWNPDVEYVNRENRPEWIIVGLVGQVKILKGQPVNDRWIKMRDVSETVEEWMIR